MPSSFRSPPHSAHSVSSFLSNVFWYLTETPLFWPFCFIVVPFFLPFVLLSVPFFFIFVFPIICVVIAIFVLYKLHQAAFPLFPSYVQDDYELEDIADELQRRHEAFAQDDSSIAHFAVPGTVAHDDDEEKSVYFDSEEELPEEGNNEAMPGSGTVKPLREHGGTSDAPASTAMEGESKEGKVYTGKQKHLKLLHGHDTASASTSVSSMEAEAETSATVSMPSEKKQAEKPQSIKEHGIHRVHDKTSEHPSSSAGLEQQAPSVPPNGHHFLHEGIPSSQQSDTGDAKRHSSKHMGRFGEKPIQSIKFAAPLVPPPEDQQEFLDESSPPFIEECLVHVNVGVLHSEGEIVESSTQRLQVNSAWRELPAVGVRYVHEFYSEKRHFSESSPKESSKPLDEESSTSKQSTAQAEVDIPASVFEANFSEPKEPLETAWRELPVVEVIHQLKDIPLVSGIQPDEPSSVGEEAKLLSEASIPVNETVGLPEQHEMPFDLDMKPSGFVGGKFGEHGVTETSVTLPAARPTFAADATLPQADKGVSSGKVRTPSSAMSPVEQLPGPSHLGTMGSLESTGPSFSDLPAYEIAQEEFPSWSDPKEAFPSVEEILSIQEKLLTGVEQPPEAHTHPELTDVVGSNKQATGNLPFIPYEVHRHVLEKTPEGLQVQEVSQEKSNVEQEHGPDEPISSQSFVDLPGTSGQQMEDVNILRTGEEAPTSISQVDFLGGDVKPSDSAAVIEALKKEGFLPRFGKHEGAGNSSEAKHPFVSAPSISPLEEPQLPLPEEIIDGRSVPQTEEEGVVKTELPCFQQDIPQNEEEAEVSYKHSQEMTFGHKHIFDEPHVPILQEGMPARVEEKDEKEVGPLSSALESAPMEAVFVNEPHVPILQEIVRTQELQLKETEDGSEVHVPIPSVPVHTPMEQILQTEEKYASPTMKVQSDENDKPSDQLFHRAGLSEASETKYDGTTQECEETFSSPIPEVHRPPAQQLDEASESEAIHTPPIEVLEHLELYTEDGKLKRLEGSDVSVSEKEYLKNDAETKTKEPEQNLLGFPRTQGEVRNLMKRIEASVGEFPLTTLEFQNSWKEVPAHEVPEAHPKQETLAFQNSWKESPALEVQKEHPKQEMIGDNAMSRSSVGEFPLTTLEFQNSWKEVPAHEVAFQNSLKESPALEVQEEHPKQEMIGDNAMSRSSVSEFPLTTLEFQNSWKEVPAHEVPEEHPKQETLALQNSWKEPPALEVQEEHPKQEMIGDNAMSRSSVGEFPLTTLEFQNSWKEVPAHEVPEVHPKQETLAFQNSWKESLTLEVQEEHPKQEMIGDNAMSRSSVGDFPLTTLEFQNSWKEVPAHEVPEEHPKQEIRSADNSMSISSVGEFPLTTIGLQNSWKESPAHEVQEDLKQDIGADNAMSMLISEEHPNEEISVDNTIPVDKFPLTTIVLENSWQESPAVQVHQEHPKQDLSDDKAMLRSSVGEVPLTTLAFQNSWKESSAHKLPEEHLKQKISDDNAVVRSSVGELPLTTMALQNSWKESPVVQVHEEHQKQDISHDKAMLRSSVGEVPLTTLTIQNSWQESPAVQVHKEHLKQDTSDDNAHLSSSVGEFPFTTLAFQNSWKESSAHKLPEEHLKQKISDDNAVVRSSVGELPLTTMALQNSWKESPVVQVHEEHQKQDISHDKAMLRSSVGEVPLTTLTIQNSWQESPAVQVHKEHLKQDTSDDNAHLSSSVGEFPLTTLAFQNSWKESSAHKLPEEHLKQNISDDNAVVRSSVGELPLTTMALQYSWKESPFVQVHKGHPKQGIEDDNAMLRSSVGEFPLTTMALQNSWMETPAVNVKQHDLRQDPSGDDAILRSSDGSILPSINILKNSWKESPGVKVTEQDSLVKVPKVPEEVGKVQGLSSVEAIGPKTYEKSWQEATGNEATEEDILCKVTPQVFPAPSSDDVVLRFSNGIEMPKIYESSWRETPGIEVTEKLPKDVSTADMLRSLYVSWREMPSVEVTEEALLAQLSLLGVDRSKLSHREARELHKRNILLEIHAINKILGCQGDLHAPILDQIRLLYIFLGMEPLSWIMDVDDLDRARAELDLIKTVIGVK